MQPRILCILLALAPLSVVAQDHIDPNAQKAGPGPAQAKGGDRTAGLPAAAGPAPGGGAETINAQMIARMNTILNDPAELAKGKLSFENHCVGCHGPKGEGSRGPALAQPKLPRAKTDENLLQIVQRGIPNTEMPSVRLKTGEAAYLAAYVRALGKLPVEPVPGDPKKGEELFNTKGACMTCHTRQGQGMAIGPDLTEIGLRRSPTFLRRSIVEPGAEVPQSFSPTNADTGLPANFLFIRAKTKAGKDVAGVRVNENTFSIQLRDLTGAIHSFQKADLAELHKDKGMSPMPVYAAVFSPSELDDLVAYLVSLKGPDDGA